MNDRQLTYQLNPLVEAQKGFSVMETRLFYLGLQDINPHVTEGDRFYDEQFPDTVISPSELTRLFGHSQYITEVDKATDGLIGKYISIKFENGFEKFTIFQHIKYIEGKGLFIKFNEDMRPFILDIYKSYKKYGFTKVEMQQIFVLGSAYAMRLLELLLQYRSTEKDGIIEQTFDVDYLRSRLDVPEGTYKGRISNFRRKVLDLPIKDINKNTQYFVDYEVIKKGRKICGFKFLCNCNNSLKDNEYKDTIDNQIDGKKQENNNSGKIEDRLITKLVNYGFSLDTIEGFLEKCEGVDDLAARLEFGENKIKKDSSSGKKISSVSGYLRKAIEENWLGLKLKEEESQKRELESVKFSSDIELWIQKNFSNEKPNTSENPFDISKKSHKMLINIIKDDIKNRRLSITSKRGLTDRGLTVSRFVELYMM